MTTAQETKEEATQGAKAKTTAKPAAKKATGAKTGTKAQSKTTTKAKSGDLFLTIATEVEQTTKDKLHPAIIQLNEATDENNFKLGGLLQRVLENGWFGEHESFGDYVTETLGFKERKARYLIEIYNNIVHQGIPYAKVKKLGWTKLKELAKHLTTENVDEWVARAEKVTVKQLQEMLAGGNDEKKEKTSTTSDITNMTFKMHPDQTDVVEQALNKAKVDVESDHDNVALNHICTQFLMPNENAGAVIDNASVKRFLGSMTVEEAVSILQEAHPELEFAGEDE